MSSSKSSSTSSSKADSITMTADGHIVGSSQPQHRRSTVEAPTSLEMQPEDRLLRHPEGMNIALDQAKMWAKYAKDLVAYLEKRTAIEMEYNRSVMKNANTLKTSIGEEVSFNLKFFIFFNLILFFRTTSPFRTSTSSSATTKPRMATSR